MICFFNKYKKSVQKHTDFFDNSLLSIVPDIPLVIRNKLHNNQLCTDLSRLISAYPVVSHFLRFAWQTTIAGKSVDEVIKDMKTDGATSIGQLIEILDYYGIRHAEKNKRISKKNPVPYKYSILTVHTDAGYTHWTLLYDDKYYDPEFGLIEGEYTHGKITSFLEIYAE